MEDRPERSTEGSRKRPILLVVFLILFVISMCMVFSWGLMSPDSAGLLSGSVHSEKVADYSSDPPKGMAALLAGIIREAILDYEPISTVGIDDRISTLDAGLLTPVPTATGTLSQNLIPATLTPSVTSTPTSTITSTAAITQEYIPPWLSFPVTLLHPCLPQLTNHPCLGSGLQKV